MTQRIVCAANKNSATGEVILGVRHWDGWMYEQRGQVTPGWKTAEQGFIDQRGQFLTRTQAWVIAEAAGQIIHRCGGDEAEGGTLYSENLY